MVVKFTLKTASGSNVISADCDTYRRRLFTAGKKSGKLGGDSVFDALGIHYGMTLEWDYMSAAEYEALRKLYYSGETLYLDDGNVPPLTETFTYGAATVLDFDGIENPSGTHSAYSETSATTWGFDPDEHQETEIDTTSYGEITDLDASHDSISGVAGQYCFHVFKFLSPISQEDIYMIAINLTARSSGQWNGFQLGGYWRNKKWSLLSWSTAEDGEHTISYATAYPAAAQDLVSPDDDYIRLFCMSYSLNPTTHYVDHIEVHLNYATRITLTHVPILDSGDVIWVKNLTDPATLELATDYTISDSTISVSNQDSGDVIEVKYNRYHQVRFVNVPEDWLTGDPASDRNRGASITLETINTGVEDS